MNERIVKGIEEKREEGKEERKRENRRRGIVYV